ncbi:MAG TPA: cache domain-containing protein [Alphaproteobacteria bacterium]|nr:cache domain-containing protein [Alphaproteobacteria bacterium]
MTILRALMGAILGLFLAGQALAAEFGTAEEAKAMVERALAAIKQNGPEAAFKQFEDPQGGFKDRDLYVFVYDMNGVNLSHGANKALIGKNLKDLKDTDGKFLIQEMIKLAAAGGDGWVDYKWQNPVSKKIEAKSSYVKGDGALFVGVGIYKP